jgi:hypothetical protein
MRINSSNLTLTRNYLQKYRFLIKEYELVKQNKHPNFRFVLNLQQKTGQFIKLLVDLRLFLFYS